MASAVENYYRDYRTREDFNLAFDVAGCVPQMDHYIDSYVERSATVRKQVKGHFGVRYGTAPNQWLDLFPPVAQAGLAPRLVFFHGGGWHMHSARDFSFVAQGPLAAGMGVAIVSHGLCPDLTVGQMVQQARAAVSWLAFHAETFGCDPTNLAVMGHSAGGHLATMVALLEKPDRWPLSGRVSVAIPVSGIFDLEPMALSDLQEFLRLSKADIWTLSPIHLIRRSPVRFLIACGDADLLGYRSQSEEFTAAWTAAGNTGDLLFLPGKNHFDVLDALSVPDSELMNAIRSTLASACDAENTTAMTANAKNSNGD